MAVTVGIDLGTTNSLIGFVDDGRVQLVPNRRGHILTPSVIGLDQENAMIVGEAALNQFVSAPERTLRHIKRNMGERTTLSLGDRRISPEEAGAAILSALRSDTERFTGGEAPEFAVITVPAHFDDRQRNATVEAGMLAGFREIRLLNEPTAAALPYATRDVNRERILVFDFGGGTLDVTCLVREGCDYSVTATVGDGYLGGADIDRIVFDRIAREVEAQTGRNVDRDPIVREMIRGMAEAAKVELSELERTGITIPFFSGNGRVVHVTLELTREEVESAIFPVVDRAMELTAAAVGDAGFDRSGFDTLILAGGSSRLPMIRKRLFDRYPVRVASRINPEEVVCVGATQLAESRRNGRFSLHDVVSGTLALELADGSCVALVNRNQTIPTRRTRMFTTVADGQEEAEIHLLQGDQPESRRNRSLGRFVLSGLWTAARGEPRIAVTVDVNADGIVTVRAGEQQSGAAGEMVSRTRPRELHQPIHGDVYRWLESLVRRGRLLRGSAQIRMVRELNEALRMAEEQVAPEDVVHVITVLETLLQEITAGAMISEKGEISHAGT